MRPLKLVFMGTPDIAVPTLRAAAAAGHEIALVITRPDRPAGRGRKLRRGDVAAAADELGLSVAQPDDVSGMAGEIGAIGPDAMVVLAFGQILPPQILSIAPMGCINVHFSLLPQLRGAAPIQQAVLQGLDATGVSTMFMDQGLDTGDVILQEVTAIEPIDTAGTLADKLAQSGARLLVRTLEMIADGAAVRTPQDNAQSTYARRLNKAEGLVDFSRPARELDWHVRGMDPWPAAFVDTPAGPLRLFGPTMVLADAAGSAPGVLIDAPGPDMLAVACGSGALAVGQAQAPGKRRMSAGDFLRGARLKPGDRLDGR